MFFFRVGSAWHGSCATSLHVSRRLSFGWWDLHDTDFAPHTTTAITGAMLSSGAHIYIIDRDLFDVFLV